MRISMTCICQFMSTHEGSIGMHVMLQDGFTMHNGYEVGVEAGVVHEYLEDWWGGEQVLWFA